MATNKTKPTLLEKLKAQGMLPNPVRVVQEELIKEINKPNGTDEYKLRKKMKKLEEEILDTLNTPTTLKEAQQTFNDWENEVVAPLFEKYGFEYDDEYIEDFFDNVYVPMWRKLNEQPTQ